MDSSAFAAGHEARLCRTLLSFGANPNPMSRHSVSPFMFAAQYHENDPSMETVRMIRSHLAAELARRLLRNRIDNGVRGGNRPATEQSTNDPDLD
jgi:hypothetical protein